MKKIILRHPTCRLWCSGTWPALAASAFPRAPSTSSRMLQCPSLLWPHASMSFIYLSIISLYNYERELGNFFWLRMLAHQNRKLQALSLLDLLAHRLFLRLALLWESNHLVFVRQRVVSIFVLDCDLLDVTHQLIMHRKWCHTCWCQTWLRTPFSPSFSRH